MNIIALLYIEEGLQDSDLTFAGIHLPQELERRLQSIDKITGIKFSVHTTYSGDQKQNTLTRKDNDDLSFWKELFTELQADHIIKIYCDSPFFDTEILEDMLNVHIKYLAEFTYSENLPSGFTCEIISKELIDAIPEPDEKTLPLGQVIKSNINRFDVELYYKEPDIREKRISFRSGIPREMRIMERIFLESGSIPKYSQIKEIIDKNPGVLYLSPSYVEIELTGACQLDCIFCFRNTLKNIHPDMDIELFKKILQDMKTFSLPYSICLGGSGEPLMHNSFYEILDIARNETLIENIVLETNGILADINFKNYIANSNDKRIKIIFNINGMDEKSYNAIHKKDMFKTVFQNITSLKESMPDSYSIYIQIMKINETEPFLDQYYNFWEKYNIPIILQKQNTFIGKIPDRNYSDLSPLERTPCWHLQRDFNVLSDGSVIFCKQDIAGDNVRGNIKQDSIESIFEKSKNSFLRNYKKDLETTPDCSSCNEWYTFNL